MTSVTFYRLPLPGTSQPLIIVSNFNKIISMSAKNSSTTPRFKLVLTAVVVISVVATATILALTIPHKNSSDSTSSPMSSNSTVRSRVAGTGNAAKLQPLDISFLATFMHYSQASYCPSIHTQLKPFNCPLDIDRLPGVKNLDPLALDGTVNRCGDDHRYGIDNVSKLQLVSNNLDEETQSAFYLGVNPTQQRIVLSFRGTQSLREVFKTDADVPKIPASKINSAFGGDDVRVHRGFMTHYLKSKDAVQGNLTMLAKKYSDYPIMITGHSLGAALALLAGMDFAVSPGSKDFKDRLGVITYGEPRTGNENWAKLATSTLLDHHFRVQHRGDFVPHLPTTADQFFHAGPQIRLTGKFLDARHNFTNPHFTVEMCDMINGTGETSSCPSDLDESKIHSLVMDAIPNLDEGFSAIAFLSNLAKFRADLRDDSAGHSPKHIEVLRLTSHQD